MASAPFPPVAAAAASAPPRLAPRHPFAAAAAARRSSLSFRPAARRLALPLRSSAAAANPLRCAHRRAVSPRWVSLTLRRFRFVGFIRPVGGFASPPPLTRGVGVSRALQVEETSAGLRRGVGFSGVHLGRRCWEGRVPLVLPQEQAGPVGAREVRSMRAPARVGALVSRPVERR
jgi:hypothetical protein